MNRKVDNDLNMEWTQTNVAKSFLSWIMFSLLIILMVVCLSSFETISGDEWVMRLKRFCLGLEKRWWN